MKDDKEIVVSKPGRLSRDQKAEFIAGLALTGSVRAAAERAGAPSVVFLHMRREFPDFAAEWEWACDIWLHQDRIDARAGHLLKRDLDLSTEELILLRQVADHVGLAISAVHRLERRCQ